MSEIRGHIPSNICYAVKQIRSAVMDNSSDQSSSDSNPFTPPDREGDHPQSLLNSHPVIRILAFMHFLLVAGATVVATMVALAATISYADGQSCGWALTLFLLFLLPRCIANMRQPTRTNEMVVAWSVFVLLAAVGAIAGGVAMWRNSGLEESDVFLYSVVAGASLFGAGSAVPRVIAVHARRPQTA